MNGLIIKQPWIQLILEGKKTWEIRSSNSKIKGKIALIQSGTGNIFGTVELIDSFFITPEEYYNSEHLHCIPDTRINPLPYKKNHAWVLKNPVIFDEPISYHHPIGAVIWVKNVL